MGRQSGIDRREVLRSALALPLGLLASKVAAAAGCGLTPAQTKGPFFPVVDQADKDIDLTRVTGHDTAARGEVLRVRGRLLDEQCRPIAGVLVDLWQADTFGRYRHPADPNPARPDPDFQGWGQAVTDADGRYSFRTIRPAAYPLAFLEDGRADRSTGYRTPHIHFRASRRGYADLATQMYFAGERLNESDLVLRRVAVADRRKVVIEPDRDADGLPLFAFDMVLARA
jgi:protocatechuate 3,4-dioxygenase beta subunit